MQCNRWACLPPPARAFPTASLRTDYLRSVACGSCLRLRPEPALSTVEGGCAQDDNTLTLAQVDLWVRHSLPRRENLLTSVNLYWTQLKNALIRIYRVSVFCLVPSFDLRTVRPALFPASQIVDEGLAFVGADPLIRPTRPRPPKIQPDQDAAAHLPGCFDQWGRRPRHERSRTGGDTRRTQQRDQGVCHL